MPGLASASTLPSTGDNHLDLVGATRSEQRHRIFERGRTPRRLVHAHLRVRTASHALVVMKMSNRPHKLKLTWLCEPLTWNRNRNTISNTPTPIPAIVRGRFPDTSAPSTNLTTTTAINPTNSELEAQPAPARE